jgi:hypothetical protein
VVNNHNPQHRPAWQHWVRFFVGTPPRFLITALGLLVIFAAMRPDLAQQGVTNALNAIFGSIAPFFQPALMIVIIGFGFYFLLKAFRGSSGKKKDH